jgi:hypothetical protein
MKLLFSLMMFTLVGCQVSSIIVIENNSEQPITYISKMTFAKDTVKYIVKPRTIANHNVGRTGWTIDYINLFLSDLDFIKISSKDTCIKIQNNKESFDFLIKRRRGILNRDVVIKFR